MEVLAVQEVLHTFIWGWRTDTDVLQQSIKAGHIAVGGAPGWHTHAVGFCPQYHVSQALWLQLLTPALGR